ncbi:fungal-specific transcription factor domain-containing protein [Phanerochaete sordida]|uniref:Fungal-specific transcription factor domain-containing protein n=1 Tax=Phanerochaete sordida TaxID=48140 RepID=A0A9P3GW82_9APHY|nr:fungal-specific transcription factor domain-containing protein [Phanerochaete sordida]
MTRADKTVPPPRVAPSAGSAASGSGAEQPPVKQRRKPGRVPVSCAECRRLKLRCDRKVPCETCVKRGCSAICPEGSLTTGNRSNRLAFADADELQKKVERLRGRVKALENGLRTLQADVSDDPHPLLLDTDEATAIIDTSPTPGPSSTHRSPQELPSELEPPHAMSRDDEEFVGAFGTLTLGVRGESRYYGSTARSEFLVHGPSNGGWAEFGCHKENFPRFSQLVYDEALKTFDTTCDVPEARMQVWQLLPTLGQACRLVEIFLEIGDFLWQPVPRTQLYDEILSVIYRSLPIGLNDNNVVSSHAAAVLYMVFALASLFDPDLPQYSTIATEYFLLSRLALRCASPVHDTTLWAIQALIYQVQFSELWSDGTPTPHFVSHNAWVLEGFVAKLAHSIGLHVKSSRWHLDEEASTRRASVFWQVFVRDTWLSFTFGRPPTINLSWVDCGFPKDPEERIDANGHAEWGFHPWTWQYSKLLHTVHATAFAAGIPQYTKILELDRKIRDYPVPYSMRGKCGQHEASEPSKALHMQRYMCMASKEITLLNLHRPYFAQALNDSPGDLLKHRYAPSVLAIYRSAWRLIEALRFSHERVPFVIERWGIAWSLSMSASIVMCLMVTRAPKSSFALASMHELDRLCDIFQRCADRSRTAANNVDVVRKLQRQASEALTRAEHQPCADPALCELDRLGGKTHLIASGRPGVPHSVPSPAGSAGSASSSSTLADAPPGPARASASASPHCATMADEHVHPIIVSDLHTFEGMSLLGGGGGGGDAGGAGGAGAGGTGGSFDYHLAAPWPLPLELDSTPDFATLQEVTGYLGPDYFGSAAPPAQRQALPQLQQQTQTQQQQHVPQQTPRHMQHAQQQQAMQDVQYAINGAGSGVRGAGGGGGGGGGMPPMQMATPVLDATWQSFVEQLGF